MAASFQTDSGQLLIEPAAVASFRASQAAAGLPTTGVIVLVGEAAAGPDFTEEGVDLEDNAFGADQEAEVVAKYGSGPLVQAYKGAIKALADEQITGSVGSVIIAKTNVSAKATLALTNWADAAYNTLADKNYGKAGNLLSAVVTANTSEVVPTTSSFTYIPGAGTIAYSIRANGAASVGGTLAANTTPVLFVSTLAALAGVLATGGADLAAHPASGNISITATGNNVVIATTAALGAIPTVGDTLVIPVGSVIDGGAGDDNVGAYVITAATANSISATKLSDAGKVGGGGAVPGTITPPVTVGSTALSGTPANDVRAYGAVVITLEAGDPLDGQGKSLEIAQLTTGTDLLERATKQLGTTTNVTWVSKTGAATTLTSASEYEAKLTVARASDQASADFIAGGEIALTIGYLGTTAALVITDDTLTTTVTGGAGANLSLSLVDFPTIADLADRIAAQPGYSCAVGNTLLGQFPPSALDDVTCTIGSAWGAKNGRVKMDAYRFFGEVSASNLVQLQNSDGDVEQALSGIPQPQTIAFLAGGTRGPTLAADVVAALLAAESVQTNFVVTCFSEDAADDIVAGLTDSGSTYTIDAVNAALKSHIHVCSQIKRKAARQGFASKRDTFLAVREAAANTASFRMAYCFEDVRDIGLSGNIEQLPPYVLAAKAAGAQAAAFYRDITGKKIDCSGVLQAAGDFNDKNQTHRENALKSGLLVAKRSPEGGFEWVSDQTTYGRDSSPLFNSISAVYRMDTLSLGMAARMERALKGQNISDVPAGTIKDLFDSNMGDFLRLRLVAPSDGAPKGYKDLSVKVSGNSCRIKAKVYDNVSLKYITIDFVVDNTTQSA